MPGYPVLRIWPWSACGQREPGNSVTSGTTRMYFRRSARCAPSTIELLKRVSAVRICPGALFVQVSNLEPFGLAVAREDSAGNLRVSELRQADAGRQMIKPGPCRVRAAPAMSRWSPAVAHRREAIAEATGVV